MDNLNRSSVGGDKGGAKDLMASHDFTQDIFEHWVFERSFEMDRCLEVVCQVSAGQFIEKPDAFLWEGKGERLAPWRVLDGRDAVSSGRSGGPVQVLCELSDSGHCKDSV